MRPWILPTALGALVFGCVQIIGVDQGSPGGPGGSGGASSSGSTSSSSGGGTSSSCDGGAPCSLTNPCAGDPCAVSCTATGCCVENQQAMGGACSYNGGHVCDGDGACVGCIAAMDCPAMDCESTSCEQNSCTYMPLCELENCGNGGVCQVDCTCSQ